MTDIVERLRQPWPPSNSEDPLMTEAADEIERLRAAIAIIRGETLEEAAKVADAAAMVHGSGYSIDDIRDVAAAIRALKEGK